MRNGLLTYVEWIKNGDDLQVWSREEITHPCDLTDEISPENFQVSSEVISLKHLKRRDSTTAQVPHSNHHPRTHFYTEILAAREIV